ncbi:uncharacterized protein LOC130726614 [Lotus japonicus]|uniref:uncharacterized protein LOC130726614 n=1 Tax=Lotus japonicus TaxID=34305 RepID=UPI00258F17ED|nr:uncharacterized protein LOC130726614 [Lotus japonicus]
MDTEQEEMQFLGLFGVYRESSKIIVSCRKIFSQITLTLILPLTFILLIHLQLSNMIISSEWATYWLLELTYITFLLIFSLLSTSAIVYTVASIYTARDITFRGVLSVVPRVWKRLMVTFLSTFVALFIYNFVAFFVLVILALTGLRRSYAIPIMVVMGIFYIAGFVYLTVIWLLASVVTVLEDFYGFKAMMKSNELIKGKMGLSILIVLMLNVPSSLIYLLFNKLVVQGMKLGYVERTAYGILCLILLSHMLLFGLVIQSVLYFVCKSYHHQNIDKSALSDHLEVYHGEYEPLKAKGVQLEHYLV